MKSTPRYSIITVTLNSEYCILNALESLKMQTFEDYEFILVDGLSKDNTVSIVQKSGIKNMKIISEADNGIYDAMNKGISVSKGEYVYFLNSDDRLYSNEVLSYINKFLNENNNPDLLYGDIILAGEKESYHVHPEKIERKFLAGKTISHQAIFANKKLFNIFGGFDVKYKILADYVWLAAIITSKKVEVAHVSFPICLYSTDGISSKSVYWKERHNAYRNYFSMFELIRFFYFPWVCKRVRRKMKYIARCFIGKFS